MDEQKAPDYGTGKSAEIGPDEASQLIKKFAEQHKIEIKLTEEQLGAILDQWNEMDPRLPAEITFYAGERATVNLKVAGYRYSGDTCCV